MKRTISESEMVADLLQDDYASWTAPGARALVEWLQALEEDTNTEMEWDRVAIRCEWDEYPSALAAAEDYGIAATDENTARLILEDRTALIEVPGGGVIVQQH